MSATLPAESAIHRVECLGISLPSVEPVRAYLTRHPDTTGAAVEACERAREVFPPGTVMRLELYRDPEIDDEYLALYARPPDFGTASYALFRSTQRGRAPLMRAVSGNLMILPDFAPSG